MCNKCNGTGWETTQDWVPYGSTSVSMESSDFCRHCILENKCPVCDTELTCPDDVDIVFCPCGYHSETNCPPIFEEAE